jgi:hypothetical protein
MQQVFAARQLLMGDAFLDNQGGLGILDVASLARRGKSSHTIPLCRRGLLNLTCIPGMPPSISIKLGALNQKADAKEPIGREAGRGHVTLLW